MADPTTKTPPTIFKTSVNLPADAVAALKALSDQRGTSMSEVLRQAISTEKFLADITAKDGKILIEEKDNPVRQVLLRR